MCDVVQNEEARAVPEAVGLLASARRLVEGCREPLARTFLDEWPAPSAPRRIPPAPVPAVRWLPRLQAAAPDFSAAFVAALSAAAPRLAWRRSYSAETVGEVFFENYGWSELAGLNGPIAGARVACGVLILGADLVYPPHRHEAEEIYVPLAGRADWRQGAGDWHARTPGSVIHHANHEPHAMRTGPEPLLALYLWRSADLAQTSRLET